MKIPCEERKDICSFLTVLTQVPRDLVFLEESDHNTTSMVGAYENPTFGFCFQRIPNPLLLSGRHMLFYYYYCTPILLTKKRKQIANGSTYQ